MVDRSYRNLILLWSLALVGLAVDQASKYSIFDWLARVPDHSYSLLQIGPDHHDEGHEARAHGFHLRAQFQAGPDGTTVPYVNRGALFGFLGDHKELANGGFAVVSLLAAVAIIYWSAYRATSRDPWLCAALGLILGGTLGNFYDRVVFGGVRDFLHWNYLFDWPIFNIADCCLVCGAGLLLLQAFATQKAPVTDDLPAPKTNAVPAGAVAVAAGVTSKS